MEKGNKIKIFLAIAYTVILTLFLWTFFSKFSLNDLTSYDFIKDNRNYLIQFKNLTLKADHSESSWLCWFDSIKDLRDDLTRLIFTEKSVILSLVPKYS